jgi:hypothetical protein
MGGGGLARHGNGIIGAGIHPGPMIESELIMGQLDANHATPIIMPHEPAIMTGGYPDHQQENTAEAGRHGGNEHETGAESHGFGRFVFPRPGKRTRFTRPALDKWHRPSTPEPADAPGRQSTAVRGLRQRNHPFESCPLLRSKSPGLFPGAARRPHAWADRTQGGVPAPPPAIQRRNPLYLQSIRQQTFTAHRVILRAQRIDV